jgi:hypothetical protein
MTEGRPVVLWARLDLPRERFCPDFSGAVAAGALVLGFCSLLLWHDPQLFWNDDYEISILPVFADVARSWSEGHLPLLSPYSWVCGNLAGEFQYGTFSIFVNAAVVLSWKFPLAFAQQREQLRWHLAAPPPPSSRADAGRLGPPAHTTGAGSAVLSAMLDQELGRIDWFGALGAFAWLPWAWWAMERSLDPARTTWRFHGGAVCLSGRDRRVPTTVLMLMLVGGWLALKSLSRLAGFHRWPSR